MQKFTFICDYCGETKDPYFTGIEASVTTEELDQTVRFEVRAKVVSNNHSLSPEYREADLCQKCTGILLTHLYKSEGLK